ncbi:hypothetical protein ELY25_04020 [Vreelandella populi]|uniref:HTH-like domain-containing protein n=1 Tax=Vreelandella populi TaxID=2498858 RepID=A0A3S0X3U9_9GAMM|nr:hypothetical protein ELY25_04020 [Halomonas populi]RUR49349.1 hypothetical protein ELY37_01190 [Halomonas populi]
MKRALDALGYPVGRRKARSLMREAGVRERATVRNTRSRPPVSINSRYLKMC